MRKVLILGGIVAVIGTWWLRAALLPLMPGSTEPVTVKIDEGNGVSQIAVLLKEHNLIRSPRAFKGYTRLKGVQSKLQAGTFRFTSAQSVAEIIDVLVTGKTGERNVTIPEGLTLAEIDALMAKKGFGKAGGILDCAWTCDFSTFDFLPKRDAGTRVQAHGSRLEGYLFPETYSVPIGEYNPKFFLERMLGTFRSRIIREYEQEIGKSDRTLAQLVTMSSLVEEESRGQAERPIVAGILWKRFDAKTTLGVDATIRYGLNKMRVALTTDDLKKDFAYNTRIKAGLPPGPIANASEASFLAALKPQESQYWYYLHDKQGVIHYAVTNDEHNENRSKYLR